MKINFILFLAVVILFSCSGEEEELQGKKSALLRQIDSLEKKIFDNKNMNFDRTLAFETVVLYRQFTEKFPEDSALCAEYLFRSADLQSALGEYQNAIHSLNKIYTSYRNYKKYAECIFLQGFYYQEYLKDTVSAKIFYNELIARYPDHPFARDARQLLLFFGKSDKEILQMFKEKENADTKIK